MLILTVSMDAVQGPLFVEARVKITEPLRISADVKAYEVISPVLEGLKLPFPFEIHMPAPLPPATVPFNATTLDVEQSAWFKPEATSGGFVIFIFTVSDTTGQT